MEILGRGKAGRTREESSRRGQGALLRVVVGGALLLLLPTAWRAQQAPQVSLSQTRFAAKGRNEAVLTVSRFGRYAVSAKSKQGTALQLVDRMTGPGESDGLAGKQDGRLDLLLDAGAYKVVATSHEKGQGDVDLFAKPFQEMSGPQVPVLQENRQVDGKLEDLQQLSYWIHVEERRTVHLEAQGRDLADLRLWLEGNWLVEASPDITAAFTTTGRPEGTCKLSADLNPGYYLLTAYGGPPRRWAKETGEHPFHVRWEFPALASAARIEGKVSSFGEDRYVVPKPANFFLLQLPEKKDFHLDVAPFNAGDGFPDAYMGADITKKSQDPECRIRWNTHKDLTMVTVIGSPGEPYVLQAFEKKDSHEFKGGGRYWISTIHSGYMDDNIDATGILVSSRPQTPHVAPDAADVIHVGPGKSWARKFNLLERETLFFFVEETGDYEVRATGSEANFRFEPFMISTPENYKSPEAKSGSCVWSLDKGYWVLALSPDIKGILTVEVRRKGGLASAALDAVTPDGEIKPGPAKGCVQFPEVTLDPLYTYTLYVNEQEGVDYGVILRPYPLDLAQALPVVLRPGEEVTLAFTAAEDGQLSLTAVEKATFSMWLDGASCQRLCAVAKGDHQLRLKNEGAKTFVYTLLVTPARLLPESGPSFLAGQVLESFTKFPVVREGSPLFFDFGVQEKKTALLTVETPALYRIETTGLLQTLCTVRTRTRPRLFSNEAGGIGRNCLVLQYLKEGEYQLTAQTTGRSAGHAGLRISRTEIRDGGALALGREAREDVPSGAAVLYAVNLPKAAKYGFSSIGQSKTFRSRLEDRDGWPLMEPNATAAFERELEAGKYRFMTLPWDVDTLRSTRVEEVLPPRSAEGRGPHALSLNQTLQNTWEEPEEGAERARDLYDFTLPAVVDATISLGDEQMQGFLKRKEGDRYEVVETVPPDKKPWSGTLQPGAYRLEAECSRQNDLLPYAVTVSVTQLVAGVTREVSVPAALPVSVSSEGVVELFSAGQLDTRGRLFTSPGWKLVADGDDAFNDWNFRIARSLAPGKYTLYVEGVGGGTGKTRVSMSAPPERLQQPLALPSDTAVELAGAIQVFPLSVAAGGGLLSVRASGASFLGCILEKLEGEKPLTLAQRTGRTCEIDLPVGQPGSYRLRLWSADHLSESARLRVSVEQPQSLTIAELEAGRNLKAGPAGAAAAVQVTSPGTFKITPAEGFTFSTQAEEPLVEPAGETVSLPPGTAFLKWSPASAQDVRAQTERTVVRPGPDNERRIDVAAGRPSWIDLATEPGGFSLLTARGEPGRPGCVFLGQGENWNPILSPSTYAMRETACASVGLPGAARSAQVWNTASAGSSPVTLELRDFGRPNGPEKPLSYGVSASEIPAGGKALFSLPPGGKTLDVDLEEGLAAFPYEGPSAAGVAWAEAAPARGTFKTGAGHLAVLNPTSKALLCSVGVLRNEGASEGSLGQDLPFERLFPEPGAFTMRVAVPAGRRYLLTEGSDVAAEWLDEKGTVSRGSRIELKGRAGVLTIKHGPGLVKVWTAEEGKELAARWGEAPEPPPKTAVLGTHLALSGRAASFALSLEKAVSLSFIGDSPAAAALKKAGGEEFLFVCEDASACAFDYYLEPGSYELLVRPLAGGTLSGSARLSAEEVVPITGTLGPDALIAGGDSRTFAFTVQKKGPVGIGLKTDSELLDCELLTREEKLVGQGIQQYAELEPGTYLLRVYASPGEDPVRFAPAVVGLSPPGDGPPEEYLQEFLQQIGMVEE